MSQHYAREIQLRRALRRFDLDPEPAPVDRAAGSPAEAHRISARVRTFCWSLVHSDRRTTHGRPVS